MTGSFQLIWLSSVVVGTFHCANVPTTTGCTLHKSDMDTQYNWAESLLECPASPFDHQASSVPFRCSTPDATDTQTAEPNESSKTAIEYLSEAMGYSLKELDKRQAHIIQADALTYIEKLTVGKPMTRRPRQLYVQQIRSLLRRLVPRQLLGRCEAAEHTTHDMLWKCEQAIVARAAAEYIRRLKINKIVQQRAEGQEKVAEATDVVSHADRQAFDGAEDGVEKALTKIEAWCDAWLDGKIANQDWDRMEEWCTSSESNDYGF